MSAPGTELPDPARQPPNVSRGKRLASLDAFRGFTIAGMIFVIMVAGYKDLPQTFPSFGSAPVSTWKHAEEDFDREAWAQWHGDRRYVQATVVRVVGNGRYDVALRGTEPDTLPRVYENVIIRHSKPLGTGEDVIAVFPGAGGPPSFQGVGNGCTFTDLIAPFFVFIVGVAIPLSRQRRGSEWWKHVGKRTLMLVAAGVLYISLALHGLSWWWGILQAIGIAYFMGSASVLLAPRPRLVVLAGIVIAHALLSWFVPWWTHLPADMSHGFFKLSNPLGAKLAPLNVHTTPWGSSGYGIMTIIGTFVGEALLTRDYQTVLRRCIVIGGSCTALGYAIHRLAIPMNKEHVSVSYALFTAGAAALCFALFYWGIDVKGMKAWAWPLEVFGANPLLAYFLQPLVRIVFIQLGLYSLFTGHTGWAGMAWGLAWTLVLWCICLCFNKRNIFWRL